MTAIQGKMAELGEKGKDYMPISLTAGVKDAIITRNKIEVSLELLDRFIYEVRRYPDKVVKVSWDFDDVM